MSSAIRLKKTGKPKTLYVGLDKTPFNVELCALEHFLDRDSLRTQMHWLMRILMARLLPDAIFGGGTVVPLTGDEEPCRNTGGLEDGNGVYLFEERIYQTKDGEYRCETSVGRS